jgi:hypothetical protein
VIWSRRSLPPELEEPFAAFTRTLAVIGEAKDELTSVMPTTRAPGRPLPEAILAFESAIARVDPEMAGWNVPELEHAWASAREGIDRSCRRAAELRHDEADPQGFEGLIWAVSQVLDPLDALEEAVTRFRQLRRRRKGHAVRAV